MTTATIGILCGVVAGLIVAEYTALAPLVAKSIMRRSAWIYYTHDEAVAVERAEEWQALIDARPGNLLKLGTAFFFGTGALGLIAGRAARRALRPAKAIGRYVRAKRLRFPSPRATLVLVSLSYSLVPLFGWRTTLPLDVIALSSMIISIACEVFLVRRKRRLGYRVQMDTLATETAHTLGADLPQGNGRALTEPSFVLLKIENAGWKEIVEDDYLDQGGRTGMRVTFPGRRVVGVTVTEPSEPGLRDFFVTRSGGASGQTGGFGIGEDDGAGIIRLPKVRLNPDASFKLLVLLERKSGNAGDAFPKPVFHAVLRRRRRRLGPRDAHGHGRWRRGQRLAI